VDKSPVKTLTTLVLKYNREQNNTSVSSLPQSVKKR
jgi:hypothetical protein